MSPNTSPNNVPNAEITNPIKHVDTITLFQIQWTLIECLDHPEKLIISHLPLSHHQPETTIQQYLLYKTAVSVSGEQERGGRRGGQERSSSSGRGARAHPIRPLLASQIPAPLPVPLSDSRARLPDPASACPNSVSWEQRGSFDRERPALGCLSVSLLHLLD
jgi:hypothetical protein